MVKYLAGFLDNSRTKFKVAEAVIDIIDGLKTFGFRHDEHTTKELFFQHIDFLIDKCGQTEPLIFKVDKTSDFDEKRFLDNREGFFENFYRFWLNAVPLLFDNALMTLEDQKYWAQFEIDKIVRQGQCSSKKFPAHVFVDEFQDINPLDLNFIKSYLKLSKASLSIVGDEDQAIYEWRGSSPHFIIKPELFFDKKFQTIVLDTNYRSPANIVRMANKLISNNKNRTSKDIQPSKSNNANVEYRIAPSLVACVDDVIDSLNEVLNKNRDATVAIIGRKRAQIIPYQIKLSSMGIPFSADEDINIFLSNAFDTLCTVFKIKQKMSSSEKYGSAEIVDDFVTVFDGIIRYPLKKSDKALLQSRIMSSLQYKDHHITAIKNLVRNPVKVGTKDSSEIMSVIFDFIGAKTVYEVLDVIEKKFVGLKKDYKKSLDDIFYADPPFAYLAEFSCQYGTNFECFIQDIEKAKLNLKQFEEDRDSDDISVLPNIKLMTALRTKGREFDHVYILDCNDGIWPIIYASTEAQKEQERRLFYVAVTRPKKELIFYINESIGGQTIAVTPYLKEMGIIIE